MTDGDKPPTDDRLQVIQGYASAYGGIELKPGRLAELANVTQLLVAAVAARAPEIAFGDDPTSYAGTLAALRKREARADRERDR